MASSTNKQSKPDCIKIELVDGKLDRKNTIITPPVPADSTKRDSHVVYFPGDVQRTADEMALHRVGKKWINWSLDNTGKILQERFPTSWVWIINPCRIHGFVFSCFDNFIECNIVGSPVEFEYRDATEHLQILLQNACKHLELSLKGKKLCTLLDNKLVDPNLPLKLVGFSKGCVVLNQIVLELNQLNDSNSELQKFVKQISEIYWLDGGHSGDENTWLTDHATLEVLAKTGIGVNVHVTPYQIDDVARPWIAEEYRTFIAILKELKIDLTDKIHFEIEERSLKNHFKLLQQF